MVQFNIITAAQLQHPNYSSRTTAAELQHPNYSSRTTAAVMFTLKIIHIKKKCVF
ncbi:hypothetical protein BgiBS90_017673, partial [Biomphalaria glabrata]